MSDAAWMPIHHEEAPDAEEPAAQPASKPRETKPKADAQPAVSFVLSLPPEVMHQLYSLSATMERLADEIAIQGKAIQSLVEAGAKQSDPPKPT